MAPCQLRHTQLPPQTSHSALVRTLGAGSANLLEKSAPWSSGRTDEPEADGALDHHALRREQTGWRGGAGEAQAAPGLTSVSPVRRQAWHPSTGRAVKRTVGHLEGVLLCGASPQLPRPGGVCRHLPAVSGWAQGPLDASPRECGCPHAPGLPARVPAPAARTHWAGPSHSVSVPCQG